MIIIEILPYVLLYFALLFSFLFGCWYQSIENDREFKKYVTKRELITLINKIKEIEQNEEN